MKLRKVLFLFLILCLLFTMLVPAAAVTPEEAAASKTETTEEKPEEETNSGDVNESSTNQIFNTPVGAAVLLEMNTGRILYSRNADVQKFPASLTKIMTCMVALELCDLNDIVTVSAAALEGLEPGIEMNKDFHLQEGEEIRMEDLLYYIMLESANEGCRALAQHLCGTEAAFVELMNEKAKELGCNDTHFVNPHGLHNEKHYTTANDLMKITVEALKNETFRTITNTATYDLPATNKQAARMLSSTNQLINDKLASNYFYYSKASGVKTGYTTPAGRCLISTATNDNLNLLSVVLACQEIVDESLGIPVQRSFPETINLFEWGFKNHQIVTVASTLYPIAEIPVNMAAGSQSIALAPAQEIRTLVKYNYDPEKVLLDVSLNATSVDAPVEAGQVLGKVTVLYEGEILGTCDLAAITGVSRSEITHQVKETREYVEDHWWKWMIGILIGIAVACVLGYLLLQHHRRQQRRRKIAARRRALELERRRREWNIPDDR